MAENKCSRGNSSLEPIAISCNRILDSCRDKDYFEDTRVYLTDFGQEIIEKTSNIRVKSTKVIWTHLAVEPVQFNRGFYQVFVRFYTRCECEACVCPGKVQDFDGIAVNEKRVILYGSESNVNIFKSDPNNSGFCPIPTYSEQVLSNSPTVVCEVVDPIALSVKVENENKGSYCCCSVDDIPENVSTYISGSLINDDYDGRKLFVSLGFFSVIRIERPGQFIIDATEFSVPEKECATFNDDDPGTVFSKMSFPFNEFYPPSVRDIETK